jgi:16S rRNA (cytosine967-C5)-methyltransferase
LTDAFKQGFFEVQDANSQLVAAFLDVKPGMRVDTCAGAGGKTLHIASLMENKGQLIAMDLYEN